MNKAFLPSTLRGADRCSSGSALIVALWVVILLAMLVSAFAFDMHVEARITSYYRKRLKAESLARAGIERARMLLIKSRDRDIKNDDYQDQEAGWYSNAKRLAQGYAVNGIVDTLQTGTVTVDVVPEPGRRNVNTLTQADWERILDLTGVPRDQWQELIDCVFDWIDPDGVRRPFGAETDDYYSKLQSPYRARNGPIVTVDELLLIKGFTREIVYGGAPEGAPDDAIPMSGLLDLLTTFGDRTVNVNTATRRALMTLPGVDSDTVDMIIEERERGMQGADKTKEDTSFKDPSDFFRRFPNLSTLLTGSITTYSTTYRISSVGRSGAVARRVSCIVNVDGIGNMTVLRWVEEDEG